MFLAQGLAIRLVIGAALLIGLPAAGYLYGRYDGAQIAKAQYAAEVVSATIAAAAAQRAVAAAIRDIRVNHVTIRQEIEREVLQVPVYRDCKHPADVMQRINAALEGSGPAAPGNRGLPPADAARQ